MIPRLAAAVALLALTAAAPESRDWSTTLRMDAAALHEDIVANHPGMANALDPGFAGREAAAYALLQKRAASVTTYAGYRFALSAYAASFDDGHMTVVPADNASVLAARWPGFLTGFDQRGQVVKTRADRAPVPLGARLIACDGVMADRLARTNIGAFDGRWFLASRRMLRGGRLLVDQGNPFIRRPARCTFDIGGKPRSVTLDWQPIDDAELTRRIADTNQRTHELIGAKTLSDGTRWFTLSGFDGDPAGPDAKGLVPLIAGMRADRARLENAPRIVLDLRGNNGGSSEWSVQIAQILWGEAAVDAVPNKEYVEWRASPAVIDTIRHYAVQFAADPDAKARYTMMADGMTKANAAGRKLWREPDDTSDASAAKPAPVKRLTAPIYYVTDTGCASACLDAVDLWRALGAIGVGQETSADTLYIDVRFAALPSGLNRGVIPMKVYRDRPRPSNVPVAPDYRYPGDLRDTAKLAAWIATLPPKRP